MRRLFISLVVAAAAALVPTWAMAGNQEVAEQIAASLKSSGQLHGYKIGVKYQDGTAWLRGQVLSQEQMNAALRVAFQTPGVTRVVNNLTIAAGDAVSPAGKPESATDTRPIQQVDGALAAEQTPRPASRGQWGMQANRPVRTEFAPQQAERLPSAFSTSAVPQVNVTGLQEPEPAPAPPRTQPMRMATVAMAQPPLAVPPPPTLPAPTPAALAPTPIPVAPAPVPAAPTPVPAPIAAPTTGVPGAPLPMASAGGPLPMAGAPCPAQFNQPNMPNYAWPGYASYPNYAAVSYPKQYSATAWPYIGPFYPYPQVPLGWRKVSLEWHDGWWFLDFDDGTHHGPFSGLFRSHH